MTRRRTLGIDFAPHALPSTATAMYTALHYRPRPGLDRYLQFNNKQTRTPTSVINIEKRIVTRVIACYVIDDCDIHNGRKVLVNTSKSLFLTSCSKSHFWPSHTYTRSWYSCIILLSIAIEKGKTDYWGCRKVAQGASVVAAVWVFGSRCVREPR